MGNRGAKNKDEDADLKDENEAPEKKGPSYFAKLVNGLEDPTDRVKRLGRTQLGLTLFQLSLCIIVFVFAFEASGGGEKQFRTLFGACVGTVSSLIGAHGAFRKAEVTTRLFFVFQMWGLSTLTMYLYVNVSLERHAARLCSPTKGDYGTIDTTRCDDSVHMQRSKTAMAVLGALVSVFSAMIALDFNDALNDEMAQLSLSEGSKGGNARANRKVLFQPQFAAGAVPAGDEGPKTWEALKRGSVRRMTETSRFSIGGTGQVPDTLRQRSSAALLGGGADPASAGDEPSDQAEGKKDA